MASRYVPVSNSFDDSFSYVNEDRIDSELICIICQQPFVSPMVGTQCGHTFCGKCVTNWCQQNSSCPTCRRSTKFTPLNTRAILSQLDRLLVKCPQCHRSNIERGNLSDHIQNQCPDTIWQCNAVDLKCSWTGNREEYARHSTRCPLLILRPIIDELRRDISGLAYQLQVLMDDTQYRLNFLQRQPIIPSPHANHETQINLSDSSSEEQRAGKVTTDLTRLWGYIRPCRFTECSYCSLANRKIFKCLLCLRPVIDEHIKAHDMKGNASDVICRFCFPKYRQKLIF